MTTSERYRLKIEQLMATCTEFAICLTEREPDLPRTFDGFLVALAGLLEGTGAAVWLYDGELDALQIVASTGLPDDYVTLGNSNSLAQKELAIKATPVYRSYIERLAFFSTGHLSDMGSPFYSYARLLNYNSLYLAPLLAGSECLGVLVVYHPDVKELSREDILSWSVFAAQQFSVAYKQHAMRLQLESYILKLREADLFKDEFLNAVSHELRTPISIAYGYIELVEDAVKDQAPYDEYLEHAKGALSQMTALVSELLDFAAIRAGRFSIAKTPVDYVQLIGYVHANAEVLFRRKGIELLLDIEDASIPVDVDIRRIHQVLNNLLSNAAKFTPERKTVKLKVRTTDMVVRTEVIDEGIGIAEVHFEKIFSGFFRVDNGTTRKTSGTGLGLALTRELVKAHAGTVGVSGVPGEGSVFFFELPLNTESGEVVSGTRGFSLLPE